MQDVASRISNRIQLTTDGHRVYAEAVERCFWLGDRLRNAGQTLRLVGRQSRIALQPCYVHRVSYWCVEWYDPNPKYISTSYVERQNLSMRMGMRRFTRLTNGFSKKFENHAHQVALYFMHYNYCRVHSTLRVTPAMEAGLTDHVWTLAELCSLLPEKKPNARVDKELVLRALQYGKS